MTYQLRNLISVLASCVFLAACNSSEKRAAEPVIDSLAGDEFLILPGNYSQKTTVADLEARFGAANVIRQTEPQPRVVLFPNDPTRRAYVSFHQSAEFRELRLISVTEPNSRWRGKHGVHIGMTMAKLREINHKPFLYNGYDERRRVRIYDTWSPSTGDTDSSLGAFDVAEGDHLYFEVELGICDSSLFKKPSDLPVDEQLSSDNPKYSHLVESMVVSGIGASSSLDDEWE